MTSDFFLTLPAGNASAWTGPTGTNTYLLQGALPTLVDAGVGSAPHLESIESALDGRPLGLVVITHGHVDHASGAPALAQRWAGVPIRRMILDGSDAHGESLVDGERFDAGDGTLRVIATPGHAPDHCCFFHEDSGTLFCGDLVRSGGSIVVAASRGGNLRAYLASLERVRDLAPRRLLPGHGPAVDRPAELIDAYIRHRAERERQIVAALAEGATVPSAIADRVYPGLEAALADAARDTVLAHLVKLEEDGRAVQVEAGWALV